MAGVARPGVEPIEHLGGEVGRERALGQGVVGDDADERALERPDVVGDALGDGVEGRRLGELDVVVVGTFAQDGQPGGEVR